jgi:hypothetical protein
VALWKCQLDVRDCAKARLTHFPEEADAAEELPPEEAAAEEESPSEELDAAAEEDIVPENHGAFTLFPHHIIIACSAKSTGQALLNLAMLIVFPSLSRVVKRLHSPQAFTYVEWPFAHTSSRASVRRWSSTSNASQTSSGNAPAFKRSFLMYD